MRQERVIEQAEEVVLNKETNIILDLVGKAEGQNPPEKAKKALYTELERQKPGGKWDEEEQIVGNLEQKKKK